MKAMFILISVCKQLVELAGIPLIIVSGNIFIFQKALMKDMQSETSSKPQRSTFDLTRWQGVVMSHGLKTKNC